MHRTRAAGHTPRSEDYLEAVYHLMHEKGYASTVDISVKLKVKPPTVSSMIERLASEGYLEHELYRGMSLTKKGEKQARAVIRRHAAIYDLLTMLGIENGVAYEDAEGMEHHIHPETIQMIERLVNYLKSNPESLSLMKRYTSGQSSETAPLTS